MASSADRAPDLSATRKPSVGFDMKLRTNLCALNSSWQFEADPAPWQRLITWNGPAVDEAQTATQLYHSRQRMEAVNFLYRVPDSLEH